MSQKTGFLHLLMHVHTPCVTFEIFHFSTFLEQNPGFLTWHIKPILLRSDHMFRAHQHRPPFPALHLHVLWSRKPPTHSLLETFLRQRSLWSAWLLSSFWLSYQFPREDVSFHCADRGPRHQSICPVGIIICKECLSPGIFLVCLYGLVWFYLSTLDFFSWLKKNCVSSSSLNFQHLQPIRNKISFNQIFDEWPER